MDQDLGLRQVTDQAATRKEEMKEWIEGLTNHTFETEDWLRECDDAVVFCRLLEAIDSSLAVKYKENPKHVWGKRDNLSKFIDQLKNMKLEVIFEMTDLIEQEDVASSNSSNVLASLHELSRVAFEKYKVPLPGASKADAEIEAEEEIAEDEIDKIAHEVIMTISQQGLPMINLEEDSDEDNKEESTGMLKATMPAGLNVSTSKNLHLSMSGGLTATGGLKFDVVETDPIDKAVEKALLARSEDPAFDSEEGIQVVRLKRGQYLLLPHKKIFFVRILSGHLMVRVGGGWQAFDVWISRVKGFSGHGNQLTANDRIPSSLALKKPGSWRRTTIERKPSGQSFERKPSGQSFDRKGSVERKGSMNRRARHADPASAPPPAYEDKEGIPRVNSCGSEGMKERHEAPPSPQGVKKTASKQGAPSTLKSNPILKSTAPKQTKSASPIGAKKASTPTAADADAKPARKASTKAAARPKSTVASSVPAGTKPKSTTTPAKKPGLPVRKTATAAKK
eukprot:TRINITY_DN828_c0_g1_i1.p1 TRINITY_DN828_c0_g1~~TRINITY_DN828_c0_g1_i1.p1  ORF type:complete len:508 (+),score=119.01 TRINITY_DN828_c0_g1_i1:65-1588(+)